MPSIASIGMPAAMRPCSGSSMMSLALAAAGIWTCGLARRRRLAGLLGHLDHFERARPVGQAADEAALLERRDQPVHPRFGFEVERILHLLERRRHAGLAEMVVDVAKKLMLLARQHVPGSLGTNAERVGNVGIAVKRAGAAMRASFRIRSGTRASPSRLNSRRVCPSASACPWSRSGRFRGPVPNLPWSGTIWS